MSRLAILALSSLALGCAAVAPGLHVSEGDLADRPGADGPVRIVAISPQVLLDQAEARRKASAARARDTAHAAEYRIAPFDVLQVIVWDHPELTIPAGEFRAAELVGSGVQADGSMFYPHVGVVQVAGKTIPEVRALLTERLRKVVETPQLDVKIVSFRGKRVQVTGEVVQPSTVPLTDLPLRVQDALAAAKGLTPSAWPRGVLLTRGGAVTRLDLQAMYDEGDVSQNWLLADGDVLHVPSREEYKVFVLGEVRQPSSKVMPKGRMTLAEAIGDSAGFDPLTSNPAAIYVFRGRYEAPAVFRLDAGSPDALLLATQFQLAPHDVVYVSAYKLSTWNRVVQQILPTVQGLWQSVDLANRGVNAF